MKTAPIGIFDSGVGGLTILSELSKRFPNESLYYYGDNARAPYGDKTEEELYKFNVEIVEFLISKKIKALVMACNTSASLFLTKLQNVLSIPVIGIMPSAVKQAAVLSKNKKIGVLATTRTVQSHAYKHALLECNPELDILEVACPTLVPIIEKGEIYSNNGFSEARKYFSQIMDFHADTLIYGCSHYPYLETIFSKFTAKFINFIDPAKTHIIDVKAALEKHNLVNPTQKRGEITCWVSGDIKQFSNFIDRYLGNHPFTKHLKITTP